MSEFQMAKWVDLPQPSDVLFGRGDQANKHPGNKLFREAIKKRKTEYILAGKNRARKAKIAEEIVASLRAEQRQSPPRFLRKATANDAAQFGIPQDAWCVVDDESILEKTKQALRQKSSKWMESVQTDKTPFDDQGHLDSSLSLSILLGEQDEPESFEAAFQDDHDHQQAESFLFDKQDHLSENTSPTSKVKPVQKGVIQSRGALSQAKQGPLQTEKLPFNRKDHLPGNHSIASTSQSDHQEAMASVDESSETDFFGANFTTTNPGTILFGETVEMNKAKCTTKMHGFSNDAVWFARKEESAAEKKEQSHVRKACAYQEQDAPPCDDSKRSPSGKSTFRPHGEQEMVPMGKDHNEDQTLMDDTDVAFTALSFEKAVLPGRQSCTNHPRNHFCRPKLVKSCKMEYHTAKHHRTKFKITQEERLFSTWRTKKKSPTFLQKATASDALRLGIPEGTWFETNIHETTSQTFCHEQFGESANNDTSRNHSTRLFEQATVFPETAHVSQAMVKENLSNRQVHLVDNLSNAHANKLHQALPPSPKEAPEVHEDHQMECPQMPVKVSFDFQDHSHVGPKVTPSLKEARQSMTGCLPMEPYRLQNPCPRVYVMQSGETPHNHWDLLSNHTQVSTCQEQRLTSPSESQEDLLMTHLCPLRDARFASANAHLGDGNSHVHLPSGEITYEKCNHLHLSTTQPKQQQMLVSPSESEEDLLTMHFGVSRRDTASLQAGDSSFHENQGHFDRSTSVPLHQANMAKLEECLLAHLGSLRDSCFAGANTYRRDPCNQNLPSFAPQVNVTESPESMDYTAEGDPMQLSPDASTLYNPELLVAFLEYLHANTYRR